MTPATLAPLINRLCIGELLTPGEALTLARYPLPVLTAGAKKLKDHFCGDNLRLCTALPLAAPRPETASIPAKETDPPVDPVLFLEKAAAAGVARCALLPGWNETLSPEDKDDALTRQCAFAAHLSKNSPLRLCLHNCRPMTYGDLSLYKAAGITWARLDLNCAAAADRTDRRGLYAALAAGFSGCSALTLDPGDSLDARIALLFELRDLGIRSIPIALSAAFCADGSSQLEQKKEALQAIALCRFIIPSADILITPELGRLFGDRRALLAAGTNGACVSLTAPESALPSPG